MGAPRVRISDGDGSSIRARTPTGGSVSPRRVSPDPAIAGRTETTKFASRRASSSRTSREVRFKTSSLHRAPSISYVCTLRQRARMSRLMGLIATISSPSASRPSRLFTPMRQRCPTEAGGCLGRGVPLEWPRPVGAGAQSRPDSGTVTTSATRKRGAEISTV